MSDIPIPSNEYRPPVSPLQTSSMTVSTRDDIPPNASPSRPPSPEEQEIAVFSDYQHSDDNDDNNSDDDDEAYESDCAPSILSSRYTRDVSTSPRPSRRSRRQASPTPLSNDTPFRELLAVRDQLQGGESASVTQTADGTRTYTITQSVQSRVSHNRPRVITGAERRKERARERMDEEEAEEIRGNRGRRSSSVGVFGQQAVAKLTKAIKNDVKRNMKKHWICCNCEKLGRDEVNLVSKRPCTCKICEHQKCDGCMSRAFRRKSFEKHFVGEKQKKYDNKNKRYH